MKTKLNTLTIRNFKKLKDFHLSAKGENIRIAAENKVGKTTAYDAYLWLLFGKNSEWETQFEARPHDEAGNRIGKVVVAVEAEFNIDGNVQTLRKEQHEHIDKNGKVSYPKKYSINGEPGIKEKDFKEFIDNRICPEDKFKMLANLEYFCKTLPWTQRRKLLLDIADVDTAPPGFDGLKEKMRKHSPEAFKKILNEKKKGLLESREGIEPRIDELQRGLAQYAEHEGESEQELTDKRVKNEDLVAGLKVNRGGILESEKERMANADKINSLVMERSHRETTLKNQAGPLDDLIAEKGEIRGKYAVLVNALEAAGVEIEKCNGRLDYNEDKKKLALERRERVNKELTSLGEGDSPCSLCGQSWPEGKERPSEEGLKAKRETIRLEIESLEAKQNELRDVLKSHVDSEAKMAGEVSAAEVVKNNRLVEIDEAMQNKPEVDVSVDGEWKRMTAEIAALVERKSEPATVQLAAIEADITAAEAVLTETNKALNDYDNIAKTKHRIIELNDQEKALSQLIIETEGDLAELQEYLVAQNNIIQDAVNGMFKYVNFVLFKVNLNGSIDEMCEAYAEGTAYAGMSSGQRIYAGIDVVNALSKHYDRYVPLFIDHAESVTLPIEADTQTIKLYAKKGVKALQVEGD